MNKIENYLDIANHDIQRANNSAELKSYVASLLCQNDELQQENKKLKLINEEYEKLNKENGRVFKITNVQEYDIYELLNYKRYKDNWNELKDYITSDIHSRNASEVVEFKDGGRICEIISPNYTLMQDKTITMKEVLNKMKELEGSDNN